MTKKNKTEIKLEEGTGEVSAPSLNQTAVSIVVRLDKGKPKYDVVKITFNKEGQCSPPQILFTEIKESTAITKLMQAAHEEFDIKVIRDKLRELRGEK